MKIEMDQNAANTAQVGIICLAVAMVAYFIIVVWWDGLNDNKRDIALAKEANTAAKIGTHQIWHDRVHAVRDGGIEAIAEANM